MLHWRAFRGLIVFISLLVFGASCVGLEPLGSFEGMVGGWMALRGGRGETSLGIAALNSELTWIQVSQG